MVILISSTSTPTESVVETVSPTLIMEDTTRYVPPQEGDGMETKQVLFIPKVRLRPEPPSSSTKKNFGTRKKKSISALMMEDEEVEVELCLPDDIPHKPTNILIGRSTIIQSIHW